MEAGSLFGMPWSWGAFMWGAAIGVSACMAFVGYHSSDDDDDDLKGDHG